ncbi:MAG: hypothetical protein AAF827_15385 [Cyanobacteria bacterium P01_D01_bin.6]
MTFLQRIGKEPIHKLVQKDEIDEDLRNSLWTAMTLYYWNRCVFHSSYWGKVENSNLQVLIFRIWLHSLEQPIDTIPQYFEYTLKELRSWLTDKSSVNQVIERNLIVGIQLKS